MHNYNSINQVEYVEESEAQNPSFSSVVYAFKAGKRMKALLRKESIDQRGFNEAGEDTKGYAINFRTVWSIIVEKWWLNIFLICLPIGYASYAYNWGPVPTFFINFLGMIPLASLLGDFTEELAIHTGQIIGGLINATFGNAVEMVVAVQALYQYQFRVVQTSMLGSVLSNLLLVLGCCFFFGGIQKGRYYQQFNQTSALANIALLLLGTLAIMLCSNYDDLTEDLSISRVSAIFMLLMYLQLLLFTLVTHSEQLGDDDEDDDEEPQLNVLTATLGLACTTILVSIFSDYLVSSIDGVCDELGMSKSFVGLILIPIIGNAVEHITAVTFAIKNKIELSMGVAVGSSVQVLLFVIPFIVLVGWGMGREMDLKFPSFENTILLMSVLIAFGSIVSGRSHWLEGSLLVSTYALIAVCMWFNEPIEA